MNLTIDFEKIEEELKNIAREAAEKEIACMEEEGFKYAVSFGGSTDYLYDVCGGSYIAFRKRTSSFYRQYKYWINHIVNKWEGKIHQVEIHTFHYPRFGRQEYRVNRAVALACCEYINTNYGANCFVKSYID